MSVRTVVGIVLYIVVAGSETWSEDVANGKPHPAIEKEVSETVHESYARGTRRALRDAPIGIFDSGTGGLTVFERILKTDAFRNGDDDEGADGRLDFADESFIFLADEANMPYGNYPIVGKTRFLDDLILRDAQFLLGRRYYTSPDDDAGLADKLPVKAIVIACNTATAYGMTDIKRVLKDASVDVKVVGVIDAGAEGALEVFADGRPGAIGVVPTKGTVFSGAYPRAIERLKKEKGLDQRILVFQQGALGLAGAIDGAAEFIDADAADSTVREDYRGPSMSNSDSTINPDLLPRYAFDFEKKRMLYNGSLGSPQELQLNSVDNYVRYHLVSLLEQVRAAAAPEPLRAVIMGCTHFPYFVDSFRRELEALHDYQEDGRYIYRSVMAPDVRLIDPAVFAARHLYLSLARNGALRREKRSSDGATRAEFFVTVPRRPSSAPLTEEGWFEYDYKYGRAAGMKSTDFRVVPLRKGLLEAATEQRLQDRLPHVWETLTQFRSDNSKASSPN